MRKFPSLRGQGMIALDIETYDPDLQTRGPGVRRGGYIVGVAIATEAGFKDYFPVAHEHGENLDRHKVFSWLQEQLKTPVPKVGANLLYDLDFLEAVGVKVAGPLYDIQIAEPLIDENQYSYSLETLAQKYLKVGKRKTRMASWIEQEFNVKPNKVMNNIWRAPPEIVAPYAMGDVVLPIRIIKKQIPVLKKLDLWELFELEISLLRMLLAMRQRGVRVDLKRAEQLYEEMTNKQRQLTHAVGDIKPWNAKSLARVFDKLTIEYPRTPKTKAPSFTKLWLAQHKHPVAQTINEIRHLDKLRETFIKGFILDGHTKGRIHCQFHSLKGDENGTVTGRFSSSLPNLQQIPKRGKNGQLIRSLFLPDPGNQFGKLDYSQIEYRLIVHDAAELDLPGTEEVVKAYQEDTADFHQIIANITGLDRTSAKTINFGIAYGEGVKKLCAALGLDEHAGRKFLNNYHKRAPFMRPLMQYCIREAQKNGEIRTLFQRICHFDQWETQDYSGERHLHDHRIPGAQRAFTYAALNARIQGSAADIFKLAMRNIWRSGVCDILGPPHLIVHDEIDTSVPRSKAGREAFKELKHIMESCVELRVPLRVDGGLGKNWGSIE